MALKQRAEGYRNEAGALESKLALIKAQRNKLLAAFEGLAGISSGFAGLDCHSKDTDWPSDRLMFVWQ